MGIGGSRFHQRDVRRWGAHQGGVAARPGSDDTVRRRIGRVRAHRRLRWRSQGRWDPDDRSDEAYAGAATEGPAPCPGRTSRKADGQAEAEAAGRATEKEGKGVWQQCRRTRLRDRRTRVLDFHLGIACTSPQPAALTWESSARGMRIAISWSRTAGFSWWPTGWAGTPPAKWPARWR